jgi:hypothetical protein
MEIHFFYIGLATLFVHEMDAVRYKEWKMFPVLSKVQDNIAYYIFTGLHLPLYMTIFLLLLKPKSALYLIATLNIFFIIHFFLHLFLVKKQQNRVNETFSWTLLVVNGMSGMLSLVL